MGSRCIDTSQFTATIKAGVYTAETVGLLSHLTVYGPGLQRVSALQTPRVHYCRVTLNIKSPIPPLNIGLGGISIQNSEHGVPHPKYDITRELYVHSYFHF